MNPLFPAEIVLVLLALDAQVVLLQNNGKETRFPVEEFLQDGHPILQKGCLIKEVRIPLISRTHCVFNRVACTKSNASIVSVVVRGDLTRTKAHHLRITVFGANPFPRRYDQAELALVNDLITMEGIQQCCAKISEETAPVSDFRAGAEYRMAMAEVLIRRSLIALRKIAVG